MGFFSKITLNQLKSIHNSFQLMGIVNTRKSSSLGRMDRYTTQRIILACRWPIPKSELYLVIHTLMGILKSDKPGVSMRSTGPSEVWIGWTCIVYVQDLASLLVLKVSCTPLRVLSTVLLPCPNVPMAIIEPFPDCSTINWITKF